MAGRAITTMPLQKLEKKDMPHICTMTMLARPLERTTGVAAASVTGGTRGTNGDDSLAGCVVIVGMTVYELRQRIENSAFI